MDLGDFVECLDDGAFRALMDACIVRLQNTRTVAVSLIDVERELAKHNRIQAIKSVCGRLGLGLKEAKDLVDREVPRPPSDDYEAPY